MERLQRGVALATMLLIFLVFWATFARAAETSCRAPASFADRLRVLMVDHGLSYEEARDIARDERRFCAYVEGRTVPPPSRKTPAEIRRPPRAKREELRSERLSPLAVSYYRRLSREEVLRIKREAWQYRKWVESPLYVHPGRTRFVLATVDPIPVRLAVGYDTVIVLPFRVEEKELVLGNPDAFEVEVFGDGKAIRISPTRPFQATNLVVRDPHEEDPQGVLTFFLREAYDEPSADYVIWVVRRSDLREPDEVTLARFALSGDPSVLPPLVRRLSGASCSAGRFAERRCVLNAPRRLRLYVFDGEARCARGPCLFEVNLDGKTVVGVEGYGKVTVCFAGRCDSPD